MNSRWFRLNMKCYSRLVIETDKNNWLFIFNKYSFIRANIVNKLKQYRDCKGVALRNKEDLVWDEVIANCFKRQCNNFHRFKINIVQGLQTLPKKEQRNKTAKQRNLTVTMTSPIHQDCQYIFIRCAKEMTPYFRSGIVVEQSRGQGLCVLQYRSCLNGRTWRTFHKRLISPLTRT